MKKLSLVAVMAILLVCVISNPVWTRAESCTNSKAFVEKYFNLVNNLPYTEDDDNIITFHIKSEYAKYMEIYVNDSFADGGNEHDGAVTPDANGNVTLNLIADQNAGYPDTNIKFYFTAAPSLFPNTAANCGKAFQQYTFTPGSTEEDDEDDEEIAAIERELGTLPTTGPSIEDLKDSSFTSVSDPNNRQSLSCSYGKTDGKTVKKYSHTGIASKTDTCTTTCREDVVVTLDPPVITQSGMCFSYVVDIKTKTVCSSKFSGTPPTKILVNACRYDVNCSSNTDKAGPNDSFDSCVNSCDGGNYTQSCIDKCYTKVYGNSKNSTAKKTTKSSKEEGITYLNNLKGTNSFEEPTKLASLKTINVGVANLTCYTDKYLAENTKNLTDAQLTKLAEKVTASKKLLPGGYYNSKGTDWIFTKGFYYYDTKGGTWKWNTSGGCYSKISYHYFTDTKTTKRTIKELNGTFYYPGTSRIHKYRAEGDGFLRRSEISYDGGNTYIKSRCGELCTMSKSVNLKKVQNGGKCQTLPKKGNKQYIVTQAQANNIYKAELRAYTNSAAKCVTSSNSCVTKNSNYVIKTDETSKNTGNNLGHEYKSTQNVNQAKNGNKSSSGGSFPSMIINTNGVCVTGECANKNQLYCSNLDKNSSEYIAYCKDKESCKNSGTPACKNGNTCYDYHTTLSFPKNYINVKTGKTKVEIGKTELPFFVAIGNAYCTNLSTKEVNVDWYNYKIDDTNTVTKPSKINKYNITGQINNYGVYGWNFDFSCFYAIKNPTSGDCVGDECTGDDKKCVGENCSGDNDGPPSNNIVSNVKVRSVNLSNLFPNRNPRFNWSSEAKNVNNRNYKVDPEVLTKAIETTGDKVYDENNEDKYLDYEINLTRDAIKTIREYNKGKTYNNSDNGTAVNRLKGQGTWGVTVYQSKLLDSLGSVVTKRGLLGCNNQTGEKTCNVEGGN